MKTAAERKSGTEKLLKELNIPYLDHLPATEEERMGTGEDCITNWTNYFQNLLPREQTVYQLIYPQPLRWRGFYD